MGLEEIKLSEGKHSRLGASSSERWMGCAGSNNLVAALIAQKGVEKVLISNEEAARGTAAHHVASECLTAKCDAWELANKKIVVTDEYSFEVDQEMVDGVQMYLDYVSKRVKDETAAGGGAEIGVELGMSSVLDDEAFGTCDVAMDFEADVIRGRFIEVADYKNGKGIVVEPEKPQTRIYAYYYIEKVNAPDDTKVRLTIVQPNIPHPHGPIRSCDTTAGEIKKWFLEVVLPAMARTRDPSALLTMGEWCGFCPARDACPAVREATTKIQLAVSPDAMSDEEIGKLIAQKKTIEKFFQAVEREGLERLKNGKTVPGYKLVNTKANRTYQEHVTVLDDQGKPKLNDKNEPVTAKVTDLADLLLGEGAFSKPELLSPAQLEKTGITGAKEFVQRYAFTPVTGYSIAPLSDKRTPVRPPMDQYLEQVAAKNKAAADVMG